MEPNQVQEKTNGALIGTIIIIIILIIGGLYMWKMSTKNATPATENNSVGQTSPDDTAKIQADLNSTDVDGLDNGI